MTGTLAGRRYLLTGSTSGLGLATARKLLLDGADVAICGRSADRLAAALAELAPEALATASAPASVVGRAVGAPLDLTDGAALNRWPGEMAEQLGGLLDGVLVNTGGPRPGTFAASTDADWEAGVALLLMPVVRLARASQPVLADGGSLLLSTSSLVFEPSLMSELVISSCVRSAVSTLSKVLSREWAPRLRVNQIVPGRIRTPRVELLDEAKAQRTGAAVEAVAGKSTSTIPLGRYGDPDEFGAAASWLLSPAASYVNGATLAVDGGLLAKV